MAGTINRDDVAAVRERAPIDVIVGEHVALKPAGMGTLKGLCPFHDERSPSFHVRPAVGRYHCFGCGEGGDVISFVMKLDGLSFVEAVEYLAPRAGVTLRYESGAARPEPSGPSRARLIEAHRLAAQFYEEQLRSPEARIGRDFLRERGFDSEAAATFGVGYAPQGWSALLDHLRSRNITEAEAKASGLFSEGNRGLYDRFRGRLVWPIRDVTGDVIGFGARRLLEDDQGPKYLNTPETSLYKKASVLYGLDLAKGAIRTERTAVVVEGYTDVMACHLSGITTAVATCGTAFGEEHVKVLRRLMGDTDDAQFKVGQGQSKVIFTFDGDAAGQNAALKSFALDQQFLAHTFVAVDPDGLDPCDLRQRGGEVAVRALLDNRQPMFEFVIKTQLDSHDLNTPEGRVGALRAAAPVVARIRDRALRPEYARRLAGWLGMDVESVLGAVTAAAGRAAGAGAPGGQGTSGPNRGSADRSGQGGPDAGRDTARADAAGGGGGASAMPRPDRRDPVARAEALSLGVLLQAAGTVAGSQRASAVAAQLRPESYLTPVYRAVYTAIAAAGGVGQAAGDWVERVLEEAGSDLASTINGLAVTPLPHDKPESLDVYAASVLAKVLEGDLTRRIADLRGAMQRAGEGTEESGTIFAQIVALETQRRSLREE